MVGIQKALVLAVVVAAAEAEYFSMNAAASLKLAPAPGKDGQRVGKVKALRGAVAYAVDHKGYETVTTQKAMNGEAQEWLKHVGQSRSKIPSIKANMNKANREFEAKQNLRKNNFKKTGLKGIKDLYQEKIDHFAKARKDTEANDAAVWAKAAKATFTDMFNKKDSQMGRDSLLEVPHLTFSDTLALTKDAESGESTELRVQIPKDDAEKHTGLMFQKKLPEDAGMLFVYNMPKKQVLYMKNTDIPLEVGWFDKEGNLKEIVDMKPKDETYRYSANDVVVGIEANKGFWKKAGLAPGKAKINMAEVCDRLAIRGHNNFDLCPSHLQAKAFKSY